MVCHYKLRRQTRAELPRKFLMRKSFTRKRVISDSGIWDGKDSDGYTENSASSFIRVNSETNARSRMELNWRSNFLY